FPQRLLGEPGLEPGRGGEDHGPLRPAGGRPAAAAGPRGPGGRRLRRQARRQRRRVRRRRRPELGRRRGQAAAFGPDLGDLESQLDAGRRRRLPAGGQGPRRLRCAPALVSAAQLPGWFERLPLGLDQRVPLTGAGSAYFIVQAALRLSQASFTPPSEANIFRIRFCFSHLDTPSTRKNSSSARSSNFGYLPSRSGFCSSSGTASLYFFMSLPMKELSTRPL